MTGSAHLDLARARRIARGDRAAFQELFDSFFPRLYRFALARLDGDHDAAAETVQRTFCKAIRHLEDYRGEAALYTWFCQVCRNELADHYRRAGREAGRLVPLEDRPEVRAVLETLAGPAGEEPETAAWRADVQRLVQATIDALPDRYGEVLEWRYADGLAVKAIAGRLAISDKAAESLLQRARDAFRTAITEIAGTAEAFEPPRYE